MIAQPIFALLLLVQAPAAPGPEHFFVGRTESAGSVSIIMSGRHAVRDRSRGRIERGNILILDQYLEEQGKPPRNRMVFRRFGVTVATVESMIRRVD
jgi:hypothetical protein